jgi:hypothetical protein
MIVFELTMPNKGSWNGKWSGEGTCFARLHTQKRVPKEYWNKNFYYRWDDGWTACVSVTQMPAAEARKIARRSKGFCGYDWMIKSIIECGEILTEKERRAM